MAETGLSSRPAKLNPALGMSSCRLYFFVFLNVGFALATPKDFTLTTPAPSLIRIQPLSPTSAHSRTPCQFRPLKHRLHWRHSKAANVLYPRIAFKIKLPGTTTNTRDLWLSVFPERSRQSYTCMVSATVHNTLARLASFSSTGVQFSDISRAVWSYFSSERAL